MSAKYIKRMVKIKKERNLKVLKEEWTIKREFKGDLKEKIYSKIKLSLWL